MGPVTSLGPPGSSLPCPNMDSSPLVCCRADSFLHRPCAAQEGAGEEEPTGSQEISSPVTAGKAAGSPLRSLPLWDISDQLLEFPVQGEDQHSQTHRVIILKGP